MNSKIRSIGLICFTCIIALSFEVSCAHCINCLSWLTACWHDVPAVVTVHNNTFNRVNRIWQQTKCSKFGLSLNTAICNPDYTSFPKPLNRPEQNAIISINKENSFYRALSYVVSDTEDNFSLFKSKVDETCNELIEKAKSEKIDLDYKNPLQDNQKTTVTIDEIYAATFLLDTSIYVFVYNSPAWVLYDKCEVTKLFEEDDYFIYLQMSSEGNYDVVTNVLDTK